MTASQPDHGIQEQEQDMTELFIRPANALDDFEDCLQIYRTTADPALQVERNALEIGSYIWMRPYLALNPSHCFVLARSSVATPAPTQNPDGFPSSSSQSTAVGYLLLSLSTRQHYHQLANEYVPSLQEPLLEPPSADADTAWRPGNLGNAIRKILHSPTVELASLEVKYPRLLDRCPAHLHVDVLPMYQGQGWGTRLMETAIQFLRHQGVRGVHLLMAEGNVRARKFYEEKCGFQRWRERGEGEWLMWRKID